MTKTEADVAFLMSLIERHSSVSYARSVAHRHALAARRALESCGDRLAPGIHRAFLTDLVEYVVERSH